jgi:hypothetical protein
MSGPGDGAEQSLVWRCDLCGRLHLFVEPARHPVACHDCGNESFTGSSGHLRFLHSAMRDAHDVDPDEPHDTPHQSGGT